MNQGTISTMKSDLAIYTNCFILVQVIPALNSPKDIDYYQCKQNETKIIVPLYDVSTGKFLSLHLQLGYIVLGVIQMRYFAAIGLMLKLQRFYFVCQKTEYPMSLHVLSLKTL